MRFTPAERFLLQRNVMFYGYLRFSLRFAFYTMPVGHPIMSNILGNVGRMGAQEIKDLFGVPSNYSLPTSCSRRRTSATGRTRSTAGCALTLGGGSTRS
jgi:hypothetical protein